MPIPDYRLAVRCRARLAAASILCHVHELGPLCVLVLATNIVYPEYNRVVGIAVVLKLDAHDGGARTLVIKLLLCLRQIIKPGVSIVTGCLVPNCVAGHVPGLRSLC